MKDVGNSELFQVIWSEHIQDIIMHHSKVVKPKQP